MTLSTLSFFCRRPTILAIMEFVDAINTEDEKCESFSESSSVTIIKHDTRGEDMGNDHHSEAVEESVVKGLLGKGKSRIIFSLTLKMTRAQIFLMNESEAKFATLLQDNLLADIKVNWLFYLCQDGYASSVTFSTVWPWGLVFLSWLIKFFFYVKGVPFLLPHKGSSGELTYQ